MIFDFIEWDEHNLDHATRRLTATEIEQVIWNADTVREHRKHPDRVLFSSRTDGGKKAVALRRSCATAMGSDRSQRGRRNDERVREHE